MRPRATRPSSLPGSSVMDTPPCASGVRRLKQILELEKRGPDNVTSSTYSCLTPGPRFASKRRVAVGDGAASLYRRSTGSALLGFVEPGGIGEVSCTRPVALKGQRPALKQVSFIGTNCIPVLLMNMSSRFLLKTGESGLDGRSLM